MAVDAGSQLRRFQDETQQRARTRKPGTPLPGAPTESPAGAPPGAIRTHVAGFEVHGVTVFSDAQVAAVLGRYTGQTLAAAEIHAAANALMRHYRAAGYVLAKVFVPPQTFGEIVRLDVEEGTLEPNGIEVVNKGRRVASSAVRSVLHENLYSDRPLHRKDLERALLLADDLPGTSIGSIIYPGQEVGTARLRAVMSDEPLLSGNFDLDNFNVEPLGTVRAGATLYLNSPSGAGDQVVTRLVTSGSRSNYAYATYLRPVSANGARVGASIDYYAYDATALYGAGEIDGVASDVRVYVTYPVIRSRYTNLSTRADLSYYRIQDNRVFAADRFSSKRRIQLATLAVQGDESHDLLPGGVTLFNASVSAGSLDVEGDAAYRQFDDLGPRTAGGFGRLNLGVQRLQHIAGPWSAFVNASAQFASRNLDPSQRIYLGGPLSVSGYPVGEVSGDQGAEAHLEIRYDLVPRWGGNLQAGAFYALGWAQRQRDPWNGWNANAQSIENNVTLQSVGLQLTQTFADAWVIRGLVGWQVGAASPLRQATGLDSDGESRDFRLWFQLIRYFGAF